MSPQSKPFNSQTCSHFAFVLLLFMDVYIYIYIHQISVVVDATTFITVVVYVGSEFTTILKL